MNSCNSLPESFQYYKLSLTFPYLAVKATNDKSLVNKHMK